MAYQLDSHKRAALIAMGDSNVEAEKALQFTDKNLTHYMQQLEIVGSSINDLLGQLKRQCSSGTDEDNDY